MSRYTGPANKKSRRVGFSTLENGKDLAKRPYKPGQHGQDRKAKAYQWVKEKGSGTEAFLGAGCQARLKGPWFHFGFSRIG